MLESSRSPQSSLICNYTFAPETYSTLGFRADVPNTRSKEAPQIGLWVAAHGGWATFYPTKDDRGKSYHTLVIHLPGLQRTDVGTNVDGDGLMKLPD